MNDSEFHDLIEELIQINGNISDAMVELRYAKNNDLLEENEGEILGMLEDAEQELSHLLRWRNTDE